MDFKTLVAVVSVVMTLTGYYFYIRDILRGQTKPHAYTWLVWSLMTGIAFFGQLSGNAGAGAWITAVTAAVSGLIFVLALKRGEKNITRSDKIFLSAALLSLVPWALTENPLMSILLISVIDNIAFLPTIRKSITNPWEETLSAYALAGLKFVLAIIALDNYSLITWFYPATLIMANFGFIVLLLVQRRKIPRLEQAKVDR